MKLLLAPLALVVLGSWPQDPPPAPKPPAGAQPLPQVPDVPMTEIERKDLWQRFTPPSRIAGFYRLRQAVRGRQVIAGAVQGYLIVGQRHLSIHLHDHTARPGQPAIQASVREYTLAGTRLQMTSRLGARVPPGETPVLERDGLIEIREVVITNTTLRVMQSIAGEDFLEFERIE